MRPQTALGLLGVIGAGVAIAMRRVEPYSFKDRVALITGGSRGLGLVLARQLAAEGARLTLVARDAQELAVAAEELRGYGTQVETCIADVRQQEAVNQAVAQTIQRFGRIDMLINNAGVIKAGPIEHMGVDDYREAIDTHMMGPLFGMMAVAPHMQRQGGGRIVNIASVGGLVSVPHLVPYCASKFGLVGLSDGWRAELARHNIAVTTVCPGLLRTGSHVNAKFKGQHEQEFAWFSIADSLPGISADAQDAAGQIIAAARRGQARLTISVPANLISAANALGPGLVAGAMKLTAAALPGPVGPEGDAVQTGWESRSPMVPGLLTALADQATADNNGLIAAP